jgi:hypothetical protein
MLLSPRTNSIESMLCTARAFSGNMKHGTIASRFNGRLRFPAQHDALERQIAAKRCSATSQKPVVAA